MEASGGFDREELEHLIEEKVLEFARDPDSTLNFRGEFLETIRKRKEEDASISHEDILEEFG